LTVPAAAGILPGDRTGRLLTKEIRMWRITTCALLLVVVLAGATPAAEGEAEEPSSKPAHRVVVYYLHNTFRCAACNSMESMTRAAVLGGTGENSKAGADIEVESPFAEAIEAGLLSFASVNIDAEENKPLLTTLEKNVKIPVVAELQGEEIVAFTPLKEAWSHLTDNEVFVDYVQEGLAPMLRKVRPGPEPEESE
jgi:hypothetical protein